MSTATDLRLAWADTVSLAGNAAGEEEGERDPDLPPADDLDEDDDEPTEEELVKHPRLKKLSEEAKRHRLAAKAEKDRADAAEAALAAASGKGNDEQVRQLRIELAATKANLARPEPFKDLDAALALLDLGGIQVDDDGNVVGVDQALDFVARKYPYMVDDSGGTTTDRPSPADLPDRPSGRMTNGPKKQPGYDRALLEKRFPALRSRR